MTAAERRTVLFLCVGNACRSQMAESIWRHLAGERWQVASAGIRPAGHVHPWAIAALQAAGFPTGGLACKSLDSIRDRHFDVVVSVCDTEATGCPVWPAAVRQLHWPIPDPAKPNRADESFVEFVAVRDAIQHRIEQLLGEVDAPRASTRGPLVGAALDEQTARAAIWLAERALSEDLQGEVDLTSAALIPENAPGAAQFVTRSAGIICGLAVCRLMIDRFGGGLKYSARVEDGSRVESGCEVATVQGPARQILLFERTWLNFLGRLSGVATLTAAFVQKTSGTQCRILDTRKTTPGWRALEKYAVRCGGGHNHRMGLFDAILIKDNHLALCEQLEGGQKLTIAQAIEQSRRWLTQLRAPLDSTSSPPSKPTIEVEVGSLDQLRSALQAGPDIVLLDNMSLDSLRRSVALRDELAPRVLLEASGGVTLEAVAEIAATGLDRISVGALTHSAPNFDIGLDWLPAP